MSRQLCHAAASLLLAAANLCAQSPPDCRSDSPPLNASPQQVQAIEAWTHALAVQAATYYAPLVAMYNLRSSVAFGEHPKAPPNTIWRLQDISTPQLSAESGYVSPNTNVIYGFGFADLGPEPIILSTPDSGGRYYMVEVVDMWTNAFSYPAGGASGYKGGTFAFCAPEWHGTLPSGVQRIDAPTRWIEFQPRVFVKDQADLVEAQKVLQAITLQGLSEFSGGPTPRQSTYDYDRPKLVPGIATSHMKFIDPLQFWAIASAAMNENPPPANEVASLLPQFKYLGIELGKQWKPENVNPIVLAQMKKAAEQIGELAVGTMPVVGRLQNGWIIPPANLGDAGADYLSRLDVAVFGLTANTVQQAIYYSGILDGDNEPMTGQKRYTITLKEPMLYAKSVPPGFWSVTMYDQRTSYTVPNSINRYDLGSESNLKKNDDGSITLYIQADNPGPDKEANWLPAPKGPFYLILRNYAPPHELITALQDRATFVGPPPVVPAK